MYNTILIPTDFSHQEGTIQSLKKASTLSENGQIILLHVLDAIPAYALAAFSDDMIKNVVPNTLQSLNNLIEESGVKAEAQVLDGGSYQKIIQAAKEKDVDLIILNSHQPGVQDYLLGSTAAKVVRHAKCAVLVDR